MLTSLIIKSPCNVEYIVTFQNDKTSRRGFLIYSYLWVKGRSATFWHIWFYVNVFLVAVRDLFLPRGGLNLILYCAHTLWPHTHTQTQAYTRDLDFHLYPCTPPIKIYSSLRNLSISMKHMCLSQGAYFSFTLLAVPEKWLNCEWMWLWSAVRVWGQIRQMKVCGCQASCCWPWMGLG